MTECPCSRPTQGWLCSTCLAGFCDDLTTVDEIMHRLEASKTGDTPRPSNGSTGPTGSKPPVNLTITQRMLNIEVMLRALGGHIDRRWLTEPGWDGLADVIINHVDTLARYPFIVQYREQLAWELAECERLLNPEPALKLVGPCPEDGTPLTAPEDATVVRCGTCGDTYNINAYRHARILGALGDNGTPVRASEAVRRFTAAGLPLTPQNVKDWQRRGQLHPVAIDEHARRLYSIPDIYTLRIST